MTTASRDQNNVPTLLAGLNTDGVSLVKVLVDPSNHSLKVVDDTTGSDHGPAAAPRDANYIPALMAVSSADGVTPVVVYADVDGNLLIDSS